MDKTSFVIQQFEKLGKEKVFSIRPLDDEHPNLFLINFTTLVRASDLNPCELLFRSKQAEYFFYKQAIDKRLLLPCPNLLFYLPKGRVKAETYLDGDICPDTLEETEAFRVIDALALLHQYKSEEGVEFDLFRRFYHYKKIAPNPLPTSFEDGLVAKMRNISDSAPLVLCHNDVKRRHILFHEGRASLLDFSAAGDNAPIFDLASFFLDVDLSPSLIRSCMERYQRTVGGRAYLYQEIFDVMSFVCAYDYYRYSALSIASPRSIFKDEAKKRKQRFLQLFQESIG